MSVAASGFAAEGLPSSGDPVEMTPLNDKHRSGGQIAVEIHIRVDAGWFAADLSSKSSVAEDPGEDINMQFENFSFGFLRIDGSTYEQDVMIDRGEIRKRRKKPSKKFRENFGHTPLSLEEDVPWKCDRLVVGTGAYGRLPVMKEVQREAERRKVKLLILPTIQAIEALQQDPDDTNAILHVTC